MHAIILAAGRGSRLKQHTAERPKCLVEFRGRPLLVRTVNSLRAGGVSRVTVLGGYRSELLQSFVDDGLVDDLIVNEDWEATNMVSTLLIASQSLRAGPAIVAYGDIFFSPRIVADLCRCPSPLAIAFDPDGVALWRERFANPLDDLEDFQLSSTGSVTRIGFKAASLAQPQGQYMGLVRTSPSGFELLCEAFYSQSDQSLDMTSALQRVIESGGEIAGVANRDPWGEIDSPSDLTFFEARSTS
ncbi:phosphocholine cytidylyltransferase family protein [Leifsonia sp. NPDC056665]|uniref:phosphocholine cytidylyltransferase family protein n=1 Tax=Leifsonia sp. NPDC056665 TaxID=3345901 RepID=UPI0036B3264D